MGSKGAGTFTVRWSLTCAICANRVSEGEEAAFLDRRGSRTRYQCRMCFGRHGTPDPQRPWDVVINQVRWRVTQGLTAALTKDGCAALLALNTTVGAYEGLPRRGGEAVWSAHREARRARSWRYFEDLDEDDHRETLAYITDSLLHRFAANVTNDEIISLIDRLEALLLGHERQQSAGHESPGGPCEIWDCLEYATADSPRCLEHLGVEVLPDGYVSMHAEETRSCVNGVSVGDGLDGVTSQDQTDDDEIIDAESVPAALEQSGE